MNLYELTEYAQNVQQPGGTVPHPSEQKNPRIAGIKAAP